MCAFFLTTDTVTCLNNLKKVLSMKIKSLPMLVFFPISPETVNIISVIFILFFFEAVYLFYRFILKPMAPLNDDLKKKGEELRRARANDQASGLPAQTEEAETRPSAVVTPAESFCGKCGFPREPGDTFCGECGTRFDDRC